MDDGLFICLTLLKTLKNKVNADLFYILFGCCRISEESYMSNLVYIIYHSNCGKYI
jgi:hypothetical protein